MDKRFWGIVGILIVVFFGFVFFSGNKNESTATPTNHVTGATTSKVTLVEYGDFQCPACQAFEPTLKTVREKYADKVAFQFRNLPLTQIHQNAFAAARAAEAASEQGKFWEMHELLYASTNWSSWTQSNNALSFFKQYARQLKLDEAKFDADYKSEKVNDSINADVAAFDKTGASKATPTFFLNGKKLDNTKLYGANGTASVEAISKVLDEALAQNK